MVCLGVWRLKLSSAGPVISSHQPLASSMQLLPFGAQGKLVYSGSGAQVLCCCTEAHFTDTHGVCAKLERKQNQVYASGLHKTISKVILLVLRMVALRTVPHHLLPSPAVPPIPWWLSHSGILVEAMQERATRLVLLLKLFLKSLYEYVTEAEQILLPAGQLPLPALGFVPAGAVQRGRCVTICDAITAVLAHLCRLTQTVSVRSLLLRHCQTLS